MNSKNRMKPSFEGSTQLHVRHSDPVQVGAVAFCDCASRNVHRQFSVNKTNILQRSTRSTERLNSLILSATLCEDVLIMHNSGKMDFQRLDVKRQQAADMLRTGEIPVR